MFHMSALIDHYTNENATYRRSRDACPILTLIPALRNDFAHLDPDTSIVADSVIASLSVWKQPHARWARGSRIHALDANYLTGRLRATVAAEMVRLYNTCAPAWWQ